MATKNIVPNDNGEGGIGVTGKRWNTGFINTITGNLTGNVTGNVSGTAATVTGAAQGNITSLGTLTTLTVDDITINGSTISDAGDLLFDIGGDISLDAAGGDFIFLVGGSQFGKINFLGTNNLTISGSVADHAGLSFATHAILPAEVSATTDGTIDLGAASEQFKSIFLSGGVVVANDGTIGSAGTNGAIAIDASGNTVFGGVMKLSAATSQLTLNDSNSNSSGSTNIFEMTDSSNNVLFKIAQITGGLNAEINQVVNGSLAFKTNNTAALTLDSSGNVTVNDGDLVIGTAGHGITFSSTNTPAQNAGSGTHNTLDDYEEGTWSPVPGKGGTNVTIGSTENQEGTYVKIGRQVTITWDFEVTLTNAGTSGQIVIINSLPFACGTSSGNHMAGFSVVHFRASNLYDSTVAERTLSGFVEQGAAYIRVQTETMGTDGYGGASLSSAGYILNASKRSTGICTYFTN